MLVLHPSVLLHLACEYLQRIRSPTRGSSQPTLRLPRPSLKSFYGKKKTHWLVCPPAHSPLHHTAPDGWPGASPLPASSWTRNSRRGKEQHLDCFTFSPQWARWHRRVQQMGFEMRIETRTHDLGMIKNLFYLFYLCISFGSIWDTAERNVESRLWGHLDCFRNF